MISTVSKWPLQRIFGLSLLAALWSLSVLAQTDAPGTPEVEPAAESPLQLTAVDVQPEEPTPDTLCRLGVTLRNNGDQPLSGLRFAVWVNGHSVPVYDKQVFLEVVPPGGEISVPLYNFWVTETGRPLPEKGPLRVEVRVTDARWTKVEQEPADAASAKKPAETFETVETWTLLESLEDLPAAVTVTRKLRRP